MNRAREFISLYLLLRSIHGRRDAARLAWHIAGRKPTNRSDT